jgi:hypothetical protein
LISGWATKTFSTAFRRASLAGRMTALAVANFTCSKMTIWLFRTTACGHPFFFGSGFAGPGSSGHAS